jgi:uncharacterized protein YbaR (Trm112 family)
MINFAPADRIHPMSEQAAEHKIDPELLSILRCPLTRSPLRQEGEFLVAQIGGLRYPVREGIPVMLIEEAQLPPGVASLDELKKQVRDQLPR